MFIQNTESKYENLTQKENLYFYKMAEKHSKLTISSYNKLLDILSSLPEVPCGLPSIASICNSLNVSRTTVQKLVEILCKNGIARQDGNNRILLRLPNSTDHFTTDDYENSKTDRVEKLILEKLSAYKLKPGDRFSELELAREFDTNTVITREALLKIAQSGIIKKHPHQKWEVIEFSNELIEEIAAIRILFEGYAILAMQKLPNSDHLWKKLVTIKKQHQKLLKQQSISIQDMRSIEREFHTTIIEATHNRLIESSYSSVFTLIIFHLGQIGYDRIKIERVLRQHLRILDYLISKDFEVAEKEMKLHLNHAKESMKNVNDHLESKEY